MLSWTEHEKSFITLGPGADPEGILLQIASKFYFHGEF